jgi:hypothetical protein
MRWEGQVPSDPDDHVQEALITSLPDDKGRGEPQSNPQWAHVVGEKWGRQYILGPRPEEYTLQVWRQHVATTPSNYLSVVLIKQPVEIQTTGNLQENFWMNYIINCHS